MSYYGKQTEMACIAAAKEHAKITNIDGDKRDSFLAGVRWATERFRNMLAPSCYEGSSGYPKKYLDDLTLTDMRECLERFCMISVVPDGLEVCPIESGSEESEK